MWTWWNGIISGEVPHVVNPSISALVEYSIQDRSCILTQSGTVSIGTKPTASVCNQYVVVDEVTQEVVDWNKKIKKIGTETFNAIKDEMLKKIGLLKPHVFIVERSTCADDSFSMGINLVTTSAIHALFSTIIFRESGRAHPLGEFTVYHDPQLVLDSAILGIDSEDVIAISFETKEILIVGSSCLGDIKNSVFSVLSTLLPDHNVLPLKASAVLDPGDRVSIFFGLPGSGKTTLSHDYGLRLIGDDEIGLSKDGVFNIEGGCYGRSNGININSAPQIYQASNKFGSILENVKGHSSSEDERLAYPVNYLNEYVVDGKGSMPSNIFLLSADVSGVLPAISKLSSVQASNFFFLGYSSKLSRTGANIESGESVFSHCFGSPSFMRKMTDYTDIFKSLVEEHSINVWLINTGWYGGMVSLGKRYPLSFTKQCIRAIQEGLSKDVQFVKEDIFSLEIPVGLKDVDSSLLIPRNLWVDKEAYDLTAHALRHELESVLNGDGEAANNNEHVNDIHL